MDDSQIREFLEGSGQYETRGIEGLRSRPDILKRIRFDVTPATIMEPRLGGGETRDIAGLFFYIESFEKPPKVMLMKVGQLGVMNTIGSVDDVPVELVEKAVADPVHPPANDMYAITDEIRDWIREKLGLS
jgi:hypothetical protein